ncbi:MAG: peroxiredoxin [Wenzhouxiangellaceae bacterium]
MTLAIGDKAPGFTLPDQDEQPFTLADHQGRKLLLVFYPGDNTPVCTRQLCEYRDGIEEFTDLGIDVVGISHNDAESHRKFRERHQLPFTLLTDADLAVAEQYDCKGMLGMKRGVFVLDEQGVIIYAHVENLSLFRRRREEILAAIR